MRIGLTYDLRDDYLPMGFSEEETAEFDRADTIEAIERTLLHMGYKTDRIGHVKNLCDCLSHGHRWDIVFNICEGLYGSGREAQVPALLDAFQIPYVFSGPLVLALTLDKALTKTILRAAGIGTADQFVVHSTDDIHRIPLPFPLFAKPLSEGTGKGINGQSVINNQSQLEKICTDLLVRYRQPVLVETYLSGREFTVGIVGTGKDAQCVGVMEIILKENAEKNVYSYINKEECEDRIIYMKAEGQVARECEKVALDSWKVLQAEDGGRVDIRYDHTGVPHFMEINPLAGLHPEHSDLPILVGLNGISYTGLMAMIMESALKKVRNA